MNEKIRAIFADYDGTLCPAASLRSDAGAFIPETLGKILWRLSDCIPVCIISSKDSHFLLKRAPFANAFSCILGIETLVIKGQDDIAPAIQKRRLSIARARLRKNAKKLESISRLVQSEFPYVVVEKKRTCDDLLAGITVDWREKNDWNEPRKAIESAVRKLVADHAESPNGLYVKAYASHPFIDVYATSCDKGTGFRNILSEIKIVEEGQIMYLGDSENDNPAFRLADISIGIRSDPRLSQAGMRLCSRI